MTTAIIEQRLAEASGDAELVRDVNIAMEIVR
jgi:hypothetical protein